MILQKFVLLFEIIAIIFSVIFYKKYFNTPLKYFLILMMIITFNELSYTIYKLYTGKPLENNTIIFNIISVIEFLYFFYLYHCFTTKKNHKKIISFLSIAYLIFTIINFSFFQKLSSTGAFGSYSFAFGASSLIIVIGLYLIELLRSDDVLYLKKNLMFWISSGLLINYVGVLPSWIGFTYLPIEELTFLPYLMFSLSIFMYSCFIFGFIWSKHLSS
jgi:hypothetical protein